MRPTEKKDTLDHVQSHPQVSGRQRGMTRWRLIFCIRHYLLLLYSTLTPISISCHPCTGNSELLYLLILPDILSPYTRLSTLPDSALTFVSVGVLFILLPSVRRDAAVSHTVFSIRLRCQHDPCSACLAILGLAMPNPPSPAYS